MATFEIRPLGEQIRTHWKKHRPKMYRDLEQNGKLEESLYVAQELTSDAMYDLTVMKKLPHDQAREMVMQEWAFLPSEENVPELGFDPARLAERLP